MNHRRPMVMVAFTTLWSSGLACTAPSPPGEAAEVVLLGGSIHTADPTEPRATAFAIRAGRFTAVGSDEEIRAFVGGATRVIELDGETVLPGLIDGHSHLEAGFSMVRGLDLYGIADKERWLKMVAERVTTTAPGDWITGMGWDHTLTASPLPTRQELDRVATQHPVVLRDVDGHSAWANSLALELAGIDATTPDPEGGTILRDAAGDPTGILLETAAAPVYALVPEITAAEKRQAYRDVVRRANSVGLTGAHDMSSFEVLDEYSRMLEETDLSVRIWFGVMAGPGDHGIVDDFLRRRQALVSRVERVAPRSENGPMLDLGYVKYVLDGVMSTYTAALELPYADDATRTGLTTMDPVTLREVVARANGAGIPVAIHVIGDRAVRLSLDAFEAAARPPLPNRLEHAELIPPQEYARFVELNVVASMQPHHCITGIHKYNEARLGPERVRWGWAWRQLHDAGVELVFGSDWPTAPMNPMEQLYAAVVREKPAGGPEGGWYPQARVSLETWLHAYSQGPADVAGRGDEIGSITPGKWGDFVVLDGTLPDPIDMTVQQLRVRETWLGGNRVHGAEP